MARHLALEARAVLVDVGQQDIKIGIEATPDLSTRVTAVLPFYSF
jgi:hypothetical protein